MAVLPWSYNPRHLLNCKWHDWNIWNSYFLTLVEGFPMIFPRLTRSCKLWGLGSPLPLPHGGVWSGSDPIGLELLFRPQPWKVPRLMVRCHAFWWDVWRRSKSCWSGLFFCFCLRGGLNHSFKLCFKELDGSLQSALSCPIHPYPCSLGWCRNHSPPKSPCARAVTFFGLRLNLTFALLQIFVMTCWVVASVVCPGRMSQWQAGVCNHIAVEKIGRNPTGQRSFNRNWLFWFEWTTNPKDQLWLLSISPRFGSVGHRGSVHYEYD